MTDKFDNSDVPPDNVVPETELARRRRVLQLSEDASDLVQDLLDRARELNDLGVSSSEWLALVFNAGDYGERTNTLVRRVSTWAGPAIDAALLMSKAKAEGRDIAPNDIAKFAIESFASSRKLTRDQVDAAVREARSESCDVGDDELPGTQSPVEMWGMEHGRPMATLVHRLFAEAPKMTNPDGTPDTTQAPAVQCHVLLRGTGQQLYGAMSTTPEGLLRMLTPAMINDKKALAESFFAIEDIVSIMVERPVTAEQSRIVTS